MYEREDASSTLAIKGVSRREHGTGRFDEGQEQDWHWVGGDFRVRLKKGGRSPIHSGWVKQAVDHRVESGEWKQGPPRSRLFHCRLACRCCLPTAATGRCSDGASRVAACGSCERGCLPVCIYWGS